MKKKNRVSRRKSKRRNGGHLLAGMGFSLTRTTFDNGCGVARVSKPTRSNASRAAIADSCA